MGTGGDADDTSPPLAATELRAVFHGINDAVFVHDEQGDIVELTSSTRGKPWDSHVGILWFAPDECWLSQAAVTPLRRWVRVVLPR